MELNDRSALWSVYSNALGLSSSILGISPAGSKPLKNVRRRICEEGVCIQKIGATEKIQQRPIGLRNLLGREGTDFAQRFVVLQLEQRVKASSVPLPKRTLRQCVKG